jgi:dCMP deaminase
MKVKHLDAHMKVCLVQASLSSCPRRKVGAVLVNPERNTIIATGYNGTPRGSTFPLCAGEVCERTANHIPSGTSMELGCHHAESNAIANAAAEGIPTRGAWLVVSCSPCLMCAKLVHHAGIVHVVCVGGYQGGDAGPRYLWTNGVAVVYMDLPAGFVA